MQFIPKTPMTQGTGKISRRAREADRNFMRQRSIGQGVSSGPLGTVITEPDSKRASGGAGRDTWAA